MRPKPLRRIERPKGSSLEKYRTRDRRVTGADAAWLVDHVLQSAVKEGTARGAKLEEALASGKTGTSNGGRDAWFAGRAGRLVTVIWIGVEGRGRAGLQGGSNAAPLWAAFMNKAVHAYPFEPPERPGSIRSAMIDPKTGLRVKEGRRGAVREFFTRGNLPPKKRWWKRGKTQPVIE